MFETDVVYKCCFTGYRPQKFPFKVSISDSEYVKFENILTEGVMKLIDENCRVFYTGMAMGFDIIAAENVALLKRACPDLKIKLVCVIPFSGQEEGFSTIWRQKYINIINSADEIITLSDKYYNGCYQVRNKFMVDNCDYVFTWYDGKSGGTRNTVDYAAKKGKKIFNLNEKCENFAVQTVFEMI